MAQDQQGFRRVVRARRKISEKMDLYLDVIERLKERLGSCAGLLDAATNELRDLPSYYDMAEEADKEVDTCHALLNELDEMADKLKKEPF